MSEVLSITLNGAEKDFSELGPEPTVSSLVEKLGFRADRVALELNGQIVTRADWPQTLISNRDRIELVHFVGGGR
ncbi:MAG: sulfur carrier protein ThiS [Janthinobacterium lividum]